MDDTRSYVKDQHAKAIRSVIGTKKTVAYVSLVVVMSTVIGILFGYVA